MSHTVTLDLNGHIGIPESIRQALHLQTGQRFVILTRGDTITLVPERSMEWARGVMKGADPDHYRDREPDQGKRIFSACKKSSNSVGDRYP